jgi:hypothetical protein
VNSGPISLAADVKVESNVDNDCVMNIKFTMLNTAVPAGKGYRTTCQRLPGSSSRNFEHIPIDCNYKCIQIGAAPHQRIGPHPKAVLP